MKKISVAVIGMTVFFVLSGCAKSLDSQIVGRWNYSTELPLEDDENVKNARMRIDCADEFFPNKSVTHDCKFTLNAEAGGVGDQQIKLEITGTARATGEWSIAKETVYDKTVDGMFDIDSFSVNGQKINDEKTLAEMTEGMSKLFMKGETTVMKSLSIDKDTWVFEEEIDKNKVTITAKRS